MADSKQLILDALEEMVREFMNKQIQPGYCKKPTPISDVIVNDMIPKQLIVDHFISRLKYHL